jgi:hypothetical protein
VGSIPNDLIGIHNLSSSSSRKIYLKFTQHLPEIRSRKLGDEARLARKAEYLTVICEPIV